jgi:hypothetical protein
VCVETRAEFFAERLKGVYLPEVARNLGLRRTDRGGWGKAAEILLGGAGTNQSAPDLEDGSEVKLLTVDWDPNRGRWHPAAPVQVTKTRDAIFEKLRRVWWVMANHRDSVNGLTGFVRDVRREILSKEIEDVLRLNELGEQACGNYLYRTPEGPDGRWYLARRFFTDHEPYATWLST